MPVKNVEVISFASTHSKKTGRVTARLQASDSGIHSFETYTVVSGMFAEPLLVTQWLNDHVFKLHLEFKNKLVELINKKQSLAQTPYEELHEEDQNLIVTLNSFHIYEGETKVTVTEFMSTALGNLQKLGFLEFSQVSLASTSKNKLNAGYLVQYVV